MEGRKSGSKRASSATAVARERQQAVAALVDRFCAERLNEEYRAVCGELVGVLARKRPSPLMGGKVEGWAAGIVRTVGYVNFLDDKAQSPHLAMAEIDQAFGVSKATGQEKSRQIRSLLKIRQFDPRLTVASMMETNPLVWMVKLNGGMIADVRWLPREVQVEAFERGMIPYIPADREGGGEGAGE